MFFLAKVAPCLARTPAVARRTLSATPLLGISAAKAAVNKPNKRGRPPKDAAERKSTPIPIQEKKKIHIPKELKPPKRAPGPFALFVFSYVKSQPRVATAAENRELVRRAAEIWRGYTIAEKQPFYDERESRKAQADQAREEFFRNTSPSQLKHLNALRKAQGKPKYHSTSKSRPGNSFVIFLQEFRNSPDGQAIIDERSLEEASTIRLVRAAAQRWKSLSDEERTSYVEKFKKARHEWEAEQPHS